MTLANLLVTTIPSAPKVLNVALAATGVAPSPAKFGPFMPGNRVTALSAGAGQIFGGCDPGKTDNTKYLKFQVVKADVVAAASTIGQVAGARDASGNVTDDLVITLGTVAGQLSIGLLPANATNTASEMLGAIVKVNGKIWGRITDANAPNPAAGKWGLDADTEIGTRLILGASTGTDAITVGSVVEIIKTSAITPALLAKSGAVDGTPYAAGAALVAGVAEERRLGIVSSSKLAAVDYLAADVAAVALFAD